MFLIITITTILISLSLWDSQEGSRSQYLILEYLQEEAKPRPQMEIKMLIFLQSHWFIRVMKCFFPFKVAYFVQKSPGY